MTQKVLLIEDHTDSREVLTDALEFSGFQVIQASDGPEGEELALREAPDIILLDISLPTKSGWEVLQSLRHDEQTASIPVIALTAHARPEDEQKAHDAGCVAYIPKPVKPKQVIQTISDFFHSKPS